MSILSTIINHINVHSMASLELGVVVAVAAKLVIGTTLLMSGGVGAAVAAGGYLLAIFDPKLVTNLEADVQTKLSGLEAKVLALESKLSSLQK